MLVVGLTGGIATGKSSVAELLRRHGVPVLDADRAARELTLPGCPALAALRARFGEGIFTPGGELDRAALGRVVFADPRARADLERLLHPLIAQRLAQELGRLGEQPEPPPLVVVEIPLLFEVAVPLAIDLVLVVSATPEQQLARLVAAGMDPEQARGRLAAQLPIAAKRERADLVVENTGSRQELERHFEADIWPRLERLGAGRRAGPGGGAGPREGAWGARRRPAGRPK